MKKLLLLLIATVLLSGCGCVLSQVPPQFIYAGEGCEATLPDYTNIIRASDNCEISSFVQVPAPGYLLNPINKIVNVTLKAIDGSGNIQQVIFSVTLVDTIKPVIMVDSLLAIQIQQASDLYDAADKITAFQMNEMDKRIADTVLFPESLYPNLRNVYEDSSYFKKTMLTWTAPGHAVTGQGQRVVTFYDSDRDTLVIRP